MGIDKLELVVAEAFVSYNFVRPNYSKELQSLRDCYVAMKGSYGLGDKLFRPRYLFHSYFVYHKATLYDIIKDEGNEKYQMSKMYKETIQSDLSDAFTICFSLKIYFNKIYFF